MYRNPVGPRRLERSAPGTPPFPYRRIALEPLGMTLGACVRGADLRRSNAEGWQPLSVQSF